MLGPADGGKPQPAPKKPVLGGNSQKLEEEKTLGGNSQSVKEKDILAGNCELEVKEVQGMNRAPSEKTRRWIQGIVALRKPKYLRRQHKEQMRIAALARELNN